MKKNSKYEEYNYRKIEKEMRFYCKEVKEQFSVKTDGMKTSLYEIKKSEILMGSLEEWIKKSIYEEEDSLEIECHEEIQEQRVSYLQKVKEKFEPLYADSEYIKKAENSLYNLEQCMEKLDLVQKNITLLEEKEKTAITKKKSKFCKPAV